MEYKFTQENYEQEVLKSELPVVVDFYADWCGPCKMMAPMIKELSDKYDGRIKVGKVNTDENPGITVANKVVNIPTILFIKNGQVIERLVGLNDKTTIIQTADKLL